MADTEKFEEKFTNLMERWNGRGLELPADGVTTEVDGVKYNVSVVKEKPAKKPTAKDSEVK